MPVLDGPADLALVRGVVETLAPDGGRGEAIAIRDGRVSAVGLNRAIEAHIGPETRVVDLAGRTAIPGLVDCHVHLATDASSRDVVDVRDFFVEVRSIEDLLRRMAAGAGQTPPGDWIAACGSPMQVHRLAEGRLPTRTELDRALPSHPAYVTFGVHVLVANSEAIRQRGITGETVAPDRGVVECDPVTGEPTGVFLERARILIQGPAARHDPAFLEQAVELELERCLARGVTTIHDVVAEPTEVAAYDGLHRQGRLAARVGLIFRAIHSGFSARPWLGLGLRAGFGDPRLWFAGVKLSIDGGFTGGNAAFSEPLEGHASDGLIRIPQPELNDLVAGYDAAGIRVSIHAMGDEALEMALAAFEARVGGRDLRPSRHRIEHMGNWLCTPARLARARAVGLVPVPNPSMLFHLAEEISTELGPRRSRSAFDFGALRDAGLPLVSGSDGPGYWPIDVLRDIATMSGRRTRTGASVGDRSVVAVRDALRAQTVTAAWLGFRDADLGTLAPGMRADLAVLDAGPFETAPDRLAEVGVDLTIVDGHVVFERPT